MNARDQALTAPAHGLEDRIEAVDWLQVAAEIDAQGAATIEGLISPAECQALASLYRSNNDAGNLAFMCMPHHDQYDSITSQSKGLKQAEVERYRAEVLAHFGTWSTIQNREHLLNLLSYRIDLDEMADAAIEAGGTAVFYGIQQAFDVLTTDQFDSCDGDLWMPHLLSRRSGANRMAG